MTDRYIDLDELRSYGTHAAAELAKLEKKHPDAFHGLASAVATATAAVAKLLDAARDEDASVSTTASAGGALLPEARAGLKATGGWIASHEKHKVRPKDFFPNGRSTAGAGAAALLRQLEDVSKGYAKHKHVSEATARKKEVDALIPRLRAAIGARTDASSGRKAVTPELHAARERWQWTYRAAKLVAEGRLMLLATGAEPRARLAEVFKDLAVPSRAARGKGKPPAAPSGGAPPKPTP